MFSFKLVVLTIVSLEYWSHTLATECRYLSYDFSRLDGYPWIVEALNGTSRTTYHLSLCKSLAGMTGSCSKGTAVCRSDGADQVTPIGNFTQVLNVTEDATRGQLWLVLKGAPCASAGTAGQFTKTIINFKCGKTLGSPRLLDRYACDTYFEWHTSVACRAPPAVAEVPCHVYDADGEKRDLSPLIRQAGGHRVDSAGARGFYINVCRQITPNGTTSGCPAGTAACETTGGVVRDRGKPTGQLTITADDKLYLQYRSDQAQSGCDSPPTTSITFICPRRGGGREPLLTSDLGCHYDVEWVTEYACPERRLVSNSCTLTQSQHDIEFDLNPLKKDPASHDPYKVTVTDGSRSYDFFLNVCGELDMPCPGDVTGISACQVSSDLAKVLGRLDHQTLRYSDGELTLTYRSGDKCSSHFQREIVINFHCNRSASSDGRGAPVFNHEESCTYLFDWDTKYACLPHALPAQCHVKHDSHRFDLSALIREGRINWEALRSTHVAGDTDDDRYFLNICHEVLRTGVAQNCPAGAAVCLRDENGSYKNLGEYVSSPTYDTATGALKLHYVNGSVCDSDSTKRHDSFVKVKCKPGDLESGPDLVWSSHDRCTHEFEWRTAAGCALSTQQGSSCTVTDKDAGYSMDLSRLRKTGQDAYYKLTTGDDKYDYYINVCGAATGSPCDGAGKTSAAVCQVSRADPTQLVSAGTASQVVSYYNGLVNLTYTGGDNYRSEPPHPRSAQIAFLCQPDAGAGHPEFVHEASYTYSFRWRTAYVCPEDPVECVVTDPNSGQQYDLSSLARASGQGNWVTSEAGTSRRFYLNVCRPLNGLTGGVRCDPQSAACMTHTAGDQQAEEVGVANLGRAESGPTMEGDGQLLLTYRNGAACNKTDGTRTNYTTKIHLRCQRGELNEAPRLMITEEDCTYVFLWETATACPLGSAPAPGGPSPGGPTPGGPSPAPASEDCAVKDPNSEFVFDLKALRKQRGDYSVGDLTVNVCGAVHVAGCNQVAHLPAAVCNGTTAVAGVSSQLRISDNGRLSLSYPGTRLGDGQKKDVVLRFECNKAAIAGPLRVSRSSAETLELSMETALACAPEPVDCVITDRQGREYDLSPLSRSTDNWKVMDPRVEHFDITYYINVCHTLNPVPDANCPGGAIGGCQVTKGHGVFNLGYVQSMPVAGQQGSLSIRYLGGDVCHKGTPQESRRSTRIIFECSDTQTAPVFQSETADCEYIFTWKTPSACPLQTVTGSECRVTEPLYHYTFDLRHLRKVGDHDYSVTAGEYTYLLNVCGPLAAGHGACAGDVGACQTKTQPNGDVTAINAGIGNQKLRYNDGELTLTYTGGKGPCHGKFNRTTIISFVCDHTTMGTRGPAFINESSDCTYLFEWRTSLACTSFQLVDCTIKDAHHREYDLSALTLTSDNYVYDRAQRRYLLNVCTTLVHMKGSTCPLNSAACYIDSEETDTSKKFVKLGEASGRLLTFDSNGNIQLTYTRGQNCTGAAAGLQHQTVITFVCKKDAIASSPTLVFNEQDCIFHFVWETRIACPVTAPAPATNNCTVRNPVTGYQYNLISLSRPEGYRTGDGQGHELLINVCGPLTGSDCEDNPGSCQRELVGNNGPWNAGMANRKLHFIDGDLFLNYSSGDVCHHNNLTRNTVINFVCAKNGTGRGLPVFVDEDDDCNYFLSWHTELACERQVRCEVEDDKGNVLDLSPLVRGSGSHLALMSDATSQHSALYYINVCRPLNPISGALCPPQAAACRVKDGEKPKSLGRVSRAPVFDKNTRNVFMVYDHGAPCSQNNGRTNASSRINFVCKPGPALGQPILEMVTSDCQYIFEWETNVVCTDNKTPKSATDCRFTDSRLQHTYDLSALTKRAGSTTEYTVKSGKSTYYINVCSAVVGAAARTTGCGGAAVCLVDEQGHGASYGVPAGQQFIMESSTLKVSYTGGKTCGSGKAASYFLFECNSEIPGLGQPEIFSVSSDGCEVVFKWQTPLACLPVVKDCSLADKGGAVYDLQLLSRNKGSWNVSDGYGNTFWLNLCQGLHGSVNSSDCPQQAAACRRDAHGQVDMLGLVQTQRISMADDEKTIVVEYSQGSKTCAQRRRRRDDDRASIKISLQCANTVGQPVFVPRRGDKDSCAFEFTWKSPAACKQTRIPVTESHGVLVDPLSGGMIDLSPLNQAGDHIVNTGDSQFFINLQRAVSGEATAGDTTGSCRGAAVCLRAAGSSTGTDLGHLSTRTFYMSDELLQVEFTSNTSCQSDTTHKATTIIILHCITTSTSDKEPLFRTKTRSCVYLFEWYTPHACVQAMIRRPVNPPGSKAASGSGTPVSGVHANTAGIVVGIVITLSVIFVLVGIFYKAERRQTFRRGVRRIFQRRHGGSLIKYSTLSSLDEDESLIPDNSTNSASATLSDLPSGLPTFDDDSDEDLIL